MKKKKNPEPKTADIPVGEPEVIEPQVIVSPEVDENTGLYRQGWIGLAAWMSFGLLLEGLVAFRIPEYLNDSVRRELFRLAHVHGTLLSIALLIAGLYLRANLVSTPGLALTAFRIGTVLMPAGFLLGGVIHYESDPNPAVFLAPLGGLLVIFGVIATAVSVGRK